MYKLKKLLAKSVKLEWVGDSRFGALFNCRQVFMPVEALNKNLIKNYGDKFGDKQ